MLADTLGIGARRPSVNVNAATSHIQNAACKSATRFAVHYNYVTFVFFKVEPRIQLNERSFGSTI